MATNITADSTPEEIKASMDALTPEQRTVLGQQLARLDQLEVVKRTRDDYAKRMDEAKKATEDYTAQLAAIESLVAQIDAQAESATAAGYRVNAALKAVGVGPCSCTAAEHGDMRKFVRENICDFVQNGVMDNRWRSRAEPMRAEGAAFSGAMQQMFEQMPGK